MHDTFVYHIERITPQYPFKSRVEYNSIVQPSLNNPFTDPPFLSIQTF